MASWFDLKGTFQTLFHLGKNKTRFNSSAPTVQRDFLLPDASVDLTGGTNGQVLTKISPTSIGWQNGGGGGASSIIIRGFGIDGVATVGTNKALSILVPSAVTIVSIKAYARTAPTGADLIFDINKNGTTIFTAPVDRIKIPAGTNNSTVGTFSAALAANDVLELDIDQVGSSVAGEDIVIVIEVQ